MHKDPVQEKIITAVCAYFQITEDDLKQGSSFTVVRMRWLSWYLTKKNTFLSAAEIGKRMGYSRNAVDNGVENIICQKKIYVQTVCNLKEIAQKAGISEF